MTECERLASIGCVDPAFFEPEKRVCDVPSDRKKIWAVQIDMIMQLEKICKKYGLTYYALGGTAIGAVRHNGFIPWDDDIDVGMKREDYNKLLSVSHEFEEPYFMQTPETDPVFYASRASLRNSNTTCIMRGNGVLTCNNGIMIHIFPLDGYTDTPKYRWFIKKSWFFNLVALNAYRKPEKNARFLVKVLHHLAPIILMGSVSSYYKRHEAKCTKISSQQHDMLGIQYAHFAPNTKTFIWRKEVFDDVQWLPFEYSHIAVPANYDEMLRNQFGDYMQYPPESEWVEKHGWETDVDTPYKEYCHKKYGVEY